MSSDEPVSGRASLGEHAGSDPSGGEIRTFLIADMRGYTRFTEDKGDEQAAALAARYAALARDVVSEFGGAVIELRGDEALAVFGSARQALRAAVVMQRRSRMGQELPLGIGIGLDAGEALPVEGGYRGGALNLASRLCGLAAPGQILVSETVIGLARRVEGIHLERRRSTRLKGLAEPVQVVEAVPDPPLPPLPAQPIARHSFIRRHRWPLVAAAAAVIGLAIVLPLAFMSSGSAVSESVVSVPRSFTGLVEIDARTNEVLKRIQTPSAPSTGALANGSLWVGEPNGVEEVNPSTGRVLARIPVTGGVPGGLGGDTRDGLWLAHPELEPFTLQEIDPYRKTVIERRRLPGRPTAGPYVGEGFVWLVIAGNTIFKIDPNTAEVVDRIPYSFPSQSTAGAAATGEGAFWIADPHGAAPGSGLKFGEVVRIDAVTDEVTEIAVPSANGVAVGGGAVWTRSGSDAGNPGTGDVTEINPATSKVIQTIPLPRADWITASDDAVWVENDLNHTAVRINPATGEIVHRLILPPTTKAISELGGSLWVVVFP